MPFTRKFEVDWLELQRLFCEALPIATSRKTRFIVGGCPNIMFPYTCPLHEAVCLATQQSLWAQICHRYSKNLSLFL